MTLSVSCADNCQRVIRSVVLTVHRTVIHSRRLRFVYSRRESRRMANGHPYGGARS